MLCKNRAYYIGCRLPLSRKKKLYRKKFSIVKTVGRKGESYPKNLNEVSIGSIFLHHMMIFGVCWREKPILMIDCSFPQNACGTIFSFRWDLNSLLFFFSKNIILHYMHIVLFCALSISKINYNNSLRQLNI